jgi:signal transduction histidine kinase
MDSSPMTPARKRFRLTVIGAAIYLGIGVYFYFIRRLGGEDMVLFSDIYRILASWIASVTAFVVYYLVYKYSKERGFAVRGATWAWIGLACLSWCVGRVLYLYFEVVLHEVPFPSWADLFSSLFYLLFTLALFTEYHQRDVILTPRQSYEIAFLTVIMTAASGYFIIYPSIANTSISLLESLLGILYPLGSIVLVYSVLNMLVTIERPTAQRPWLLVLLGLLSYTLADSSYTYMALKDRYTSGNPLDIGWVLGFALVTLGAYEHYLWHTAEGYKERERTSYQERPWFSLRIKFTLFSAVLILIVILIVGGITMHQQRETIANNYRQLVWFSLNAIRANSRQALKVNDMDRLGAVVENHQAYSYDLLAYVVVLNEDGEVLAHAPPHLARSSLSDLHPVLVKKKDDLVWPKATDERKIIDVAVPLIDPAEEIENSPKSLYGQAVLGIKLKEWKESVLRLNNTLIAVTFVALVLGLISASLLANTLTRPLKTLVEATKRAGQGALEEEVQVESGDEIGFLAHSFNQMISGLRNARQMREDLTRMIIHDMRNPLVTIKSALNAMGTGPKTTEEQSDFVRIARESSEGLLDMIGTLLDLSRLEEGQLTLKYEAICLPDLVEVAVEQVAPLAEDRRIVIERDVPSSAPEVQADREQLRRVLINLLDNAIKFSPLDGRVVIGVNQQTKMGDEIDSNEVCISVTDYGKGIPAQHQPRIFDKFYQAESMNGGTGLGLAFCKLVVETHKGRIWVESEEGKGSTFYLTLPLTSGDQAA